MFRSDNCRFHRLLVAMPSRASKLTYQALLTPQRLRASSIRGRTLELEVLSDTGRIVASSAFRRLQTKAQVFSLERNAAVRTRLTHSLEVSMYGQFIAERTFELLLARGRIPRDLRLAFVQTVQNACLLHDIGNPPFGHLGEFAIRDWFAKNGDELAAHWVASGMKTKAATAYMAGFLNFDGNPQGLRIVTRLMWLNDQWGLNLTCTLLGSTLKYLGTAPDPDRPFRKKAGFFEAERGRVRSAWSTLGLRTDRKGDPVQRHPLVFLMEAADDIAYCLSDIEDALEKKVCTQAEFFGEIDAIRTSLSADARRAARKAQATIRSGVRNEASNAAFIEFSRAVTRQLTELAAKSFERNENEILDGSYANALLDDDPAARAGRRRRPPLRQPCRGRAGSTRAAGADRRRLLPARRPARDDPVGSGYRPVVPPEEEALADSGRIYPLGDWPIRAGSGLGGAGRGVQQRCSGLGSLLHLRRAHPGRGAQARRIRRDRAVRGG